MKLLIDIFNIFVKITAFPVQFLCFRTKIYYKNKSLQSRRIKGPAIIVSNHTSVYDYAVFIFVFIGRTLRYQMAECLYKKVIMRIFLTLLGGIFVNRTSYDFGFVKKSCDILSGNGVVGIFPEGRIPNKEEEKPIDFKTSATYIAIESGAPIIPIYTNGSYFKKERARVLIGEPINPADYWNDKLEDKENIDNITKIIRKKVIELRDELNEKIGKSAET